MTGGIGWRQRFHHLLPWEETITLYWLTATPCWSLQQREDIQVWKHGVLLIKYQSCRQAPLTLSWCQHSTLAAGHGLSHTVDVASQPNENLSMPHAAVMMKPTEHTEQLFVWFRSFGMCPGIKVRFYLTGVNHPKSTLYTLWAESQKSEQWKMWQSWQISGFITEQ